MKTKTIIILLALIGIALSIYRLTRGNELQIDVSNVDSAVIEKYSLSDTISYKPKRLTETQLNSFAEKWNDCGDMKLTKYLSKFRIHLYLKDGTVLGFRCNGKAVKQKNDWTCDFDDDHYFDKLYSEAK